MATAGAKYKLKLIDRINAIEDRDVLDEVNRLLEVDVDDTPYQTTAEQKQEIEEARSQLVKGEGIPSQEADKEIEKWLSK